MKLSVTVFNSCSDLPQELPDVIGFVGITPEIRKELESVLPQYSFFAMGTSAQYDGVQNPIAFRKDRFALHGFEHFWLSDTPRVPGSRFGTDQSKCPRICTAAVLMSLADGKCFRVYNTHLDHVGAMAQAQGITLVLSRIAQDDALYPDTPVFLTGDFNIRPENPIVAGINAFRSCGKPLTDVTADVGGTFHAYKPSEVCIKIDYIFTNAACDASASRTLTDEENGVFFSDHYPVLAEAEI